MTDRFAYPLFAAVLVALAVYGVVRAITHARGRRLAWAAVVVWMLATVFMTVRPGTGRGVRLNLVPWPDGRGSAFDAILNTGVFVPLGLLLATLGWRLVLALAAGLAVSLTIEVVQYVSDLGRTADVNDLITNTLGAGIGWGAAWLLMSLRSRPRGG
ncbi:VanZ family protein [Salinibacterium soli]|uniref:VanZ family protein n=1 Tax=Antiquaquibacter soli TaxID=3064523 RepID=A0ABT9BPU1_9MICO|nr:VanZ family protein [Protaetiibacter sp. WY-16]MDO7883041.1 VanZ family protein [Protaetiibacter sp. WY-16]